MQNNETNSASATEPEGEGEVRSSVWLAELEAALLCEKSVKNAAWLSDNEPKYKSAMRRIMVLERRIDAERVHSANDPKLSDGGAWRGSCVVERSEGIRTTKKGGSE